MSSSWAAFLPENIAKHPADFVGPNVIGTIVQAFETGVLVNQSLRFWSRASEERLSTKLLVAFVSLAAWFVLCLTLFLSFPSSSHYYKVSDCNRSVQHLAYNRIGIWKLGQSLFFFLPLLLFDSILGTLYKAGGRVSTMARSNTTCIGMLGGAGLLWKHAHSYST